MSGAAGWPDGWEASQGNDEELPPVTVSPWGEADWAVVVQPDADVADLQAALPRVPAGAVFVEAVGDVDVILIYRPRSGGPPPRPGAGAGAAGGDSAYGSAALGPGFSRAEAGAVGVGACRQEVAARVGVGLDRAAAALDDVARLLGGPDAPFDAASAALFQERAGAVLGEVRHLAGRVADTRQRRE